MVDKPTRSKKSFRLRRDFARPLNTAASTLPPPGSGKKLAEIADQFTLTPEDVEELERLIQAPSSE